MRSYRSGRTIFSRLSSFFFFSFRVFHAALTMKEKLDSRQAQGGSRIPEFSYSQRAEGNDRLKFAPLENNFNRLHIIERVKYANNIYQ